MNDFKFAASMIFIIVVFMFSSMGYNNKLNHDFRMAQLECSK